MTWLALAVVLEAGPCAGCHLDVHRAFASTRHARAHDEPLFLASWQRVGRRPWCTTCHDPTRTGRGLTCELCHADVAERLQGHETRRAEVTSPDVCAHCHQFSAPEPWLAHLPMQDTVGEWRRAVEAGERRSCVSCHFAGVEHGTRGGHGPSAVVVTEAGGCFTLSAPEVGHSVPTGDPFHRLRLKVCVDDGCRQVVAVRWFQRDVVFEDGGAVERPDTRIPAGALGARQECLTDEARRRARFWRLEALHAEDGLEGIADLERVRLLRQGRLEPWRGAGQAPR